MPPSPSPADRRSHQAPARAPEHGVRGGRQTKPLPAAVRRWAEQHIGSVTDVHDASHDWERSRVWELEGGDGGRWYVKISPSVKFFTRETLACVRAVSDRLRTVSRSLARLRARLSDLNSP
ncbi:hypothetical protein [Streptomyces ardesiacus]|uniref:hypothetical protein n=1 Tax=Streptomyces ardesiacus TaxID=285564 RepID=UPI0036959FC8